jgi:hypothetical protein
MVRLRFDRASKSMVAAFAFRTFHARCLCVLHRHRKDLTPFRRDTKQTILADSSTPV